LVCSGYLFLLDAVLAGSMFLEELPHGSEVKYLPAVQEVQEMQVRSLGQEDPLEEEMATHSSILAGKPHGQRRLAGYSPWGHKEADTTNQ
jgi:hypothetical protein